MQSSLAYSPQRQFAFYLENFVDGYRHREKRLIADVSFNLPSGERWWMREG